MFAIESVFTGVYGKVLLVFGGVSGVVLFALTAYNSYATRKLLRQIERNTRRKE